MAKSRIAGKHCLRKGLLGDKIYQIVRDGEGYGQYSYVKPEDYARGLTPQLAKQRMAMSVIMRHQTLLHDFMDSCSQYLPYGTLSVQNFVRQNIKLLLDYQHSNPDDCYAVWWPLYGSKEIAPAALLITEGNAPGPKSTDTRYYYDGDRVSFGVSMGSHSVNATWGQFFEFLNMWPSMYLFLLYFIAAFDGGGSHYEVLRVHLKDDICPTGVIDWDNFLDAFDIDGDIPLRGYELNFYEGGSMVEPVLLTAYSSAFAFVCAHGRLQCGYPNQQRIISRCEMVLSKWRDVGNVHAYDFTTAYKTWYDDRI